MVAKFLCNSCWAKNSAEVLVAKKHHRKSHVCWYPNRSQVHVSKSGRSTTDFIIVFMFKRERERDKRQRKEEGRWMSAMTPHPGTHFNGDSCSQVALVKSIPCSCYSLSVNCSDISRLLSAMGLLQPSWRGYSAIWLLHMREFSQKLLAPFW